MAFLTRPGSLEAFGGALRGRRKEVGMTLEEVARGAGISKPYLLTIETGRTPGPPSEEKIRLMAGVLGLEAEEVLLAADWLRTPAAIRGLVAGEGSGGGGGVPRRGDGAIDLDAMLAGRKAEGEADVGEAREVPVKGRGAGDRVGAGEGLRVRAVPLINRVAAGGPAEFGDMGYPAGVGDAYVPTVEGEGEEGVSFAVKVTGDSMMPEYGGGGDIADGRGDGGGRDGEDCVVRFSEGSNYATTFKRIYYVGGEEGGEPTHLRLVPLNGVHAEWTVPLEEVTGIYPVVYRLLPARKAGNGNGGGAGNAAGSGAEGGRGKEVREAERQFSLEED